MPGKVDLDTGTIIGVEEGTEAWFHEVGHLSFNDGEVGMKTDYWFNHLDLLIWPAITLYLWFDSPFSNLVKLFFTMIITLITVAKWGLYLFEEFTATKLGKQMKAGKKLSYGLKIPEKYQEKIKKYSRN